MAQVSSSSSSVLSPAASAAAKAKAITSAIKHKGEQDYPKEIWYFVACTIFAAVILNVLSVVWAFQRRRSLRREEVPASPRNGKISLRRLPSAIITATRIFAFRWRIPAINMYLLEVLLTAAYFMGVLIWEFGNTQNLTPKLYSDRAGHLAASQFPLITALSAKNGAIELLTGISHGKLNLMHRAVSRVTLMLVWIHGWSRVAMDAPEIVQEPWERLGLASGLMLTVMTVISVAPIRKRYYEFFFFSHLVLVFASLITTYLHCLEPGFGYYIWPSWVVWGVDRGCRWLRYIVLSNFHAPNKSPADLELVNHDAIRITIRRWVPFGWRAGQHMFLAFPTIGPIESHPFTIATLPEGDGKETELVFVVRVRDGFTRRLRDHIQDKNGLCRAPVFLDGPYGTVPDITPFDTCVFISGGSGVTYSMPRLRELVNAAANEQACTRRIIWVWAVRHHTHVNWLSSELAKATSMAPAGLQLSIFVYVTSGDPSAARTLDDGDSGISKSSQRPDVDVEKEAEHEEKSPTDVSAESFDFMAGLKGVAISYGRPDIRKILEDAVTTSAGPVSVDVSGPESLVSTTRALLTTSFASPMAVLRGTPTIQLNVESFTM